MAQPQSSPQVHRGIIKMVSALYSCFIIVNEMFCDHSFQLSNFFYFSLLPKISLCDESS